MARLYRYLSDQLPKPQAVLTTWVWIFLAGLLAVGAWWASQPSAADPPTTSWKAGKLGTTWEWEQHWNYWQKQKCTMNGLYNGIPTCDAWSSVGKVWKPCGKKIRPPDPGRINSCNIGRPGGHQPHGDGITVKYRYIKHEDRLGPKVYFCQGNKNLPANTGPGNCGTWVTNPTHTHCPGDTLRHPPDCTTDSTKAWFTTTSANRPRSTTATTRRSPSRTTATTRRSYTTTTRRPTTTSAPPQAACATPEAINSFRKIIDQLAGPSLGFMPARNGYVRFPVRAFYPGDPSRTFSTKVVGTGVSLRIWVNEISWRMTGLGLTDGTDLAPRTFRRSALSYSSADSLKSPAEVKPGGVQVVYLRSSLQAGYQNGYPVALTVTWKGECREDGTSGWTSLGERSQNASFSYVVFAIRSRPS